MPFGLGKQESKPREKFEKKVFDDFDGVIVDAHWVGNNPDYNNGPQLSVSIMNTEPSDKVQRVFLKMGKGLTDYAISEDGMLFTTEADLNENTGLAKFTADLQDKGVNFKDERFNVDGQVSAAGFKGLKAHFKWVDEEFTRGKETTSYERLGVTKLYGYVDLDKFLNEMSGTKTVAKVKAVEGVTEELLEATKELVQVFCMGEAKSHPEILAYLKSQKEVATNANLVAALKDKAFVESLGLKKEGTKFISAM